MSSIFSLQDECYEVVSIINSFLTCLRAFTSIIYLSSNELKCEKPLSLYRLQVSLETAFTVVVNEENCNFISYPRPTKFKHGSETISTLHCKLFSQIEQFHNEKHKFYIRCKTKLELCLNYIYFAMKISLSNDHDVAEAMNKVIKYFAIQIDGPDIKTNVSFIL